LEEALIFPEPIQGYKEKVFFHTLAADKEGNTFIALLNRDIGEGTPPGTVTPIGRGPLREVVASAAEMDRIVQEAVELKGK
jgi:hypothetical protein